MYEYKNKTENDIDLVGHGVVKAGAVIRTTIPINNPNLELVSENKEQPNSVVGTEAAQPNAVINAQPVVNPVGDTPQGEAK